ncbi:MAG: tRNA (adenosine(37)-N6)-dimethylallyltransferase MiaA [Cyanobacteria bacterium]|nr:tRNA (adenosine(37)-N6)-dimethylallyltransferase MiaA [Cyanobacteriota bacterium]
MVLGGATATGKTGLSLAIAQRLQTVILSADSRQVYQDFDIGTAKPTRAERAQAPHYFIDICHPTETLTVAEYQREAQALITQMHRQGDWVPMLVGGTGLYIESVVKGLQIPPVAPHPQLRSQLQNLGQPHCFELLQQLDPLAAKRIHGNDAVRTLRALEVFYVSGRALSAQQGQNPPAYPILYLGLDCEPERLGHRIAARTDALFQQGFVNEVEALCQRYGPDLPLLNTLGYAEVRGYLAGDYALAIAQALTVQHTRQFAKRQRTWFRKRDIQWLDADAPDLLDQAWGKIQTFLTDTGPTVASRLME